MGRIFMKFNGMKTIGPVLFAIILFTAMINTYGINNDSQIEQRAKAMLDKMTLEEKIDYIGGYKDFYIRPMEKLGIP
jgi:beta-glucosidase